MTTPEAPSPYDKTDVLNARSECGAKGDGVADDIAALQHCLDLLPANGGTVYIPPGTFRITQPLLPKGSGAGSLTRILLAPAAIIVNASNVPGSPTIDVAQDPSSGLVMGRLVIEGGRITQAGDVALMGIKIRAQNTVIRDMNITGFKGDGVFFSGTLAVPPIVCRIEDSIIYLNDGWGIVAGTAVSGLVISRSRIEQSGKEGVLLAGAGFVSITDNVIEGNGRVVLGSPNLRIVGGGVSSANVAGNHFESNPNQVHSLVSLEGSGEALRHVTFIGNTLIGYPIPGAIGLDVGTLGPVDGAVVQGNNFFGSKVGIRLGAKARDYFIAGNSWSGNSLAGPSIEDNARVGMIVERKSLWPTKDTTGTGPLALAAILLVGVLLGGILTYCLVARRTASLH